MRVGDYDTYGASPRVAGRSVDCRSSCRLAAVALAPSLGSDLGALSPFSLVKRRRRGPISGCSDLGVSAAVGAIDTGTAAVTIALVGGWPSVDDYMSWPPVTLALATDTHARHDRYVCERMSIPLARRSRTCSHSSGNDTVGSIPIVVGIVRARRGRALRVRQ